MPGGRHSNPNRSWPLAWGAGQVAGCTGSIRWPSGGRNAARRSPFIARSPPLVAIGRPLNDPSLEERPKRVQGIAPIINSLKEA
jgi:hypothetical protein